jgi:hypothetical protein
MVNGPRSLMISDAVQANIQIQEARLGWHTLGYHI